MFLVGPEPKSNHPLVKWFNDFELQEVHKIIEKKYLRNRGLKAIITQL